MVFDEREAAGTQDVVVGALHGPVEVREAELVVADGAVGHAEGGPVRQAPLQQVPRQHLRGAGLRAGGGARGPGPAQQQPERGLVGPPQGLHGRPRSRPRPSATVGRAPLGAGPPERARARTPGRAAGTPRGRRASAREPPGRSGACARRSQGLPQPGGEEGNPRGRQRE